MENIYFCTEARIKDFTTVLGNVSAGLIQPLIPTLAAMWIQDRVGSYFYNHLLDVYNAGTASAPEEVLISAIQQSLMWRAAADIIITTSTQITNKGPQDQYGINSSASDFTKVSLISRHYTNKAEFFDARIAAILRLKPEDYPEFTAKENNDCKITDIIPNTNPPYNLDINFL